MKIACIVLAAGRSSRFGADKLTAELCSRTVLERTLAAVPAQRTRPNICVCTTDATERIAASCGFIPARYAGGPLSESIRTGLEAAGAADGYLFVNGDQPLLRRSSITRLIETFEASPSSVCRLSFGGIQASPVLLPGILYSELLRLTSERGGMSAARAAGLAILPSTAGYAEELMDVDTPELLRAAELFLLSHPSYDME